MSKYKTLGELSEPGYVFWWEGEEYTVLEQQLMNKVAATDITCVSAHGGFFNFSADDKICVETGEMQE